MSCWHHFPWYFHSVAVVESGNPVGHKFITHIIGDCAKFTNSHSASGQMPFSPLKDFPFVDQIEAQFKIVCKCKCKCHTGLMCLTVMYCSNTMLYDPSLFNLNMN